MSLLHWGNLSSPDLLNWTEEKIALTPDQTGCADICVDVVTLSGVTIKKGVCADNALDRLDNGIYIVGGKKILVNR